MRVATPPAPPAVGRDPRRPLLRPHSAWSPSGGPIGTGPHPVLRVPSGPRWFEAPRAPVRLPSWTRVSPGTRRGWGRPRRRAVSPTSTEVRAPRTRGALRSRLRKGKEIRPFYPPVTGGRPSGRDSPSGMDGPLDGFRSTRGGPCSFRTSVCRTTRPATVLGGPVLRVGPKRRTGALVCLPRGS